MFARLVSAQVAIDKIDKGMQIWKEKDIPLSESVKGFRGAYALVDRKTGKVISMTLWDTETDAINDERSTTHQKQVDMYKGLLIGEPVSQYFEVKAKHKID